MQSYFVGTGSANPVAGATRYYNIDGTLGVSATETQVSQVCPDAITIDKFHVDLATAPGASKTLTLTLQVNGADSSPALSVAISGTNTSGTDDTHSVSVNAGDRLSVKAVLTSGGTAPSGISWTMRQTGTGQCVLFGGGTGAITATTFFGPAGNGQSTTESQVYAPIPFAGTIKNLYVGSDAAMTGTQSWTVTLRAASADTTSTCVLDVSNPTANHDTTHTPAVTAGQQLAVHVVAANSPASSRISGGFVIVPTTDGDACLLGSNQNTTANNATRYAIPHGNSASAYPSTEAIGAPQAYMQNCTLKGMYMQLHTTTGAAKSYTATVRLNGSTDTAIAVTITNAAIGNITGQSVAVADNDLLDIEIVPSGTPTAARVMTGVHYITAINSTQTPPNPGQSTAATVAPLPTLTVPGFGSAISTASIVNPAPLIQVAPAYALSTASAVAPTVKVTATPAAASATASSVAPALAISSTFAPAAAIAVAGVASYQIAVSPAAASTASSSNPLPTLLAAPTFGDATAAPVAPRAEVKVAPAAATATASSIAAALSGAGTTISLSYEENAGGGLLLGLAVFPAGLGATAQATASQVAPLPKLLAAPPASAATAARVTPAVNNTPAGTTAGTATAATVASTPSVLAAPAASAATAASDSPSLISTSSVSIAADAATATAAISDPAQNVMVTAAVAAAIGTGDTVTLTINSLGTMPGAATATASAAAPIVNIAGNVTIAPLAASATATNATSVFVLTMAPTTATSSADALQPLPALACTAVASAIASSGTVVVTRSGANYIHTPRTRLVATRHGKTHSNGRTGKTYARS